MSDSTERLLIRIDATTEQLRRELKRADKAVLDSDRRMRTAIESMGGAWRGAGKWVKQHERDIKLAGAAAAGGLALATKTIIGYSDQYRNLQGQLKLVTGSQDELNAVWNRSLSLSNATGASLDSTVNLYARMARSTEELNLSQNDLFDITQLVNQSFVVSGASATESSSAILQLSQGLAAGALRGEELNSVMENSPRLATALADGLGKTIGQLREMGKQGELTTEAVVTALQTQADAINAEFKAMPMTVGRATNEMQNLMADAFGRTDVQPLIEAIGELSAAVSDPAMVEGLAAIANGIISISSAVVSAPQDLGEWIAELLGAGAAGESSMDETVEKFAELAEKAERLRALGMKPVEGEGLVGSIFGGNSLHDTLESMQEISDMLSATDQQIVKFNGKWIVVKGTLEEYAKTQKEVAEAEEKTQKVRKEQERATKRTTEIIASYSGALEVAEETLGSLGKATEGWSDEQNRQTRKTRDVIAALDNQIDSYKELTREQFINLEVQKKGSNADEEQIRLIREKAGELYDLRNTTEQVTDDISKHWADARSTLSDFFFEFARDGNDAFDTLVEGFKSSIAKMVAEAAANEIFLQLGSAAGGLGYGDIAKALFSQVDGQTISGLFSGGSGVSGAGEAGSTAAGASSAAGSSIAATAGYAAIVAGVYKAVTDVNSGAYGFGDIVTGNSFDIKYRDELGGFGAVFSDFHKMSMQGGPSQYLTGKLFGTNINETIGNALGGKSNQAGRVTIDLSGRQIDAVGVGNSFSSKNVDALDEISGALFEFAKLIGGSTAELDVWLGRADGFRIFDEEGNKLQETKNNRDFFNLAKDLIVENAVDLTEGAKKELLDFSGSLEEIFAFAETTVQLQGLEKAVGELPESIRELTRSFSGTDEEIRGFSQAVLSVYANSQINSVTQAIEDFGRATPTALQSYRDQTSLVNTLIDNFDGSGTALQELNEVYAQNKRAAYEYATALQQVGQDMAGLTKSSVDFFTESVMSPRELFEKTLGERDYFKFNLDNAKDPEVARYALEQFNQLNRELFNLLPSVDFSSSERAMFGLDSEGNATRATGDIFAAITTEAGGAFQSLVSDTLGELEGTQGDMNARIESMLTNAGARFQEAFDTALEASQNMVTAANTIQDAAEVLAGAAEVTL